MWRGSMRRLEKWWTDAGFGPDIRTFSSVGHGIGMDGHEWPYLVKGNPTLLEVGNCFSDGAGGFTCAANSDTA